MLTIIIEEINSNTIIVGDCNTPLTSMDTSSRQKTYNETQVLNNSADQKYLIDIYRIFHIEVAKHTFFLRARKTFFRTDYMMGHKKILEVSDN